MNKKNLFAPVKLDVMDMMIHSAGKMGGHIAEVRRSCEAHQDLRFKKPKYKSDYAANY